MILLIAGGTASGKSTLARALAERTGALLIEHDRYYKSVSVEDAPGHNFDEPAALETELLIEHLDALSRGERVSLPIYDFAHHRRSEQTTSVGPRPVILVEGILALAEPALRDRATVRVFVSAEADVRLARRVRRDVLERGRDIEEVLLRYFNTVRPMHAQWIEPTRAFADLVLDGEKPVVELLSILLPIVGGA
jgi:uridine kinase